MGLMLVCQGLQLEKSVSLAVSHITAARCYKEKHRSLENLEGSVS